MNSKLLKVCAAVMLIASTGNTDAAPRGSGKKNFSVEMATKVEAIMSIETPNGDITDLSFYDINGNMAKEGDRTIPFKTYNAAAKGRIVVKAGTNVECQNGKWFVFNTKATGNKKQDSNYRLGFKLILKNGANTKQLSDECSYAVQNTDDENAWSLLVQPDRLTSTMEDGEYKGALKIAVEAI